MCSDFKLLKEQLITEFNLVGKIMLEKYSENKLESNTTMNRYLSLNSYRDGIRLAIDAIENMNVSNGEDYEKEI